MAFKEIPTLGVIRADEIYPLPVFQRLAGLSAWALRQARRRGLRYRVVGRRKYVIGRDWFAHLEKHGDPIVPDQN
jgi:hypothetical protein